MSIWVPLLLSLKVALWATGLNLVLGTAVAFGLSRWRSRWCELVDSLLTLPLVLPPTVLGYYLLIALGRRGVFGAWLDSWGISPVFTWEGAVIASTLVAFPLIQKAARAAFESIKVSVHRGPELAERVCSPGAAAGLVWTSVGGLVQYVECCKVGAGQPGRLGALKLTGQVGEVLVESAQIALSWIRSHAYELGLEPLQPPAHHTPRPITPPAPSLTTTVACAQQQQQQQQHPHLTQRLLEGILPNTATPGSSASGAPPPGGADVGPGTARAAAAAAAAAAAPSQHGGGRILEAPASVSPPPARDSPLCWDLHVHLPAGSIPKDGPSAGITLAVVLASMLSGRTVRADTAMTGELSLRGLVLPIGGVKEKLIAARHAGLTRVLVPARNMREVATEVPEAVRAAVSVVGVGTLEEVLLAAFEPPYYLLPRPRL
ncbi:MAG: hypothetical protein WDW38_006117 [Sanguina aurantia]